MFLSQHAFRSPGHDTVQRQLPVLDGRETGNLLRIVLSEIVTYSSQVFCFEPAPRLTSLSGRMSGHFINCQRLLNCAWKQTELSGHSGDLGDLCGTVSDTPTEAFVYDVDVGDITVLFLRFLLLQASRKFITCNEALKFKYVVWSMGRSIVLHQSPGWTGITIFSFTVRGNLCCKKWSQSVNLIPHYLRRYVVSRKYCAVVRGYKHTAWESLMSCYIMRLD